MVGVATLQFLDAMVDGLKGGSHSQASEVKSALGNVADVEK